MARRVSGSPMTTFNWDGSYDVVDHATFSPANPSLQGE